MGLEEEIAAHYYTAAQACEVLGLKANTFQTWIKKGKITRIVLPGRGQGYYLKRDIDRLAQHMQAAIFLDTTKDLELRQAQPYEVASEVHLAHLIYGRRVLKPEAVQARKRLVETVPEATWYLYDRELLAASINIVPVDDEAVEQFKQGKRGWLFVDTPHIRQFEPGIPLNVIVIDFMTSPTVPPEKRSFYGEILLRELSVSVFKSWGSRGIIISKVYTCGSTDAGRRLLKQSREFQELGEPVAGRVIFELDVKQSNFTLLHPYKEALAISTLEDRFQRKNNST